MPAAATLAVLAAAAPNPCHDATPALRCPDLVTAPCGERVWLSEMRARQVIADAVGRRHRIVTGAELYFKSVPSRRGSYWKFNDAARFALWAIDRAGHRTVLVRTGPELDSCPRELDRVRPGPTVPRRRFFGACNQRALTREVTPGTSVGWADVYPSKSNEANNVSSKIVRVPFNPGAQHCPRRAPPAPPAPASPDPAAG